ncbi:MAG: DUF6174 domain-containing protein [Longimicrobiales bacterium]
MHRRAALALLVLSAPPLLGAQCSITGPGEAGDLEDARERWAAAAIDNYTFVLQRSCFCAGGNEPVRIVVRDGVPASYTVVETGDPLPQEWREAYPTVEELFDIIEDAIEDADEIVVSYDSARGYPVRVDIDYIGRAIDDEMGYIISEFRVD